MSYNAAQRIHEETGFIAEGTDRAGEVLPGNEGRQKRAAIAMQLCNVKYFSVAKMSMIIPRTER